MKHCACLWGLAAVLALWPTTGMATAQLMQRLPIFSHYRCLNCHEVQDPTAAQATLNPFGNAFRNNGSRWDAVLAAQQTDGDRCTNGFELGDEDGDGRLDDNTLDAERFNPGEDDCELQLEKRAWGALKQLFR